MGNGEEGRWKYVLFKLTSQLRKRRLLHEQVATEMTAYTSSSHGLPIGLSEYSNRDRLLKGVDASDRE